MLKRALTFLPSKLKADHVKENTNDGKRLERIMLTEGEWQLMENLVEFLKRFEEITRLLGGSKYVTLSLVYPLIFSLKNYIKDMLEIYQKDSNYNENTNKNKTVSGDEVEDKKEENFDYFDLNNKDKTLINSILGGEESEGEEENEVDVYLKFKSSKNVNPLSWWKVNEKKFPFLSKVSKEYFGIAATSVLSERLFSDIGNLITTKHSSLKSEKVEKLIFLKRNASLFDN